jgi:hypothetical protein
MRPRVISREHTLERYDVVSLSAPPRDGTQVEAVMDAEVSERGQVVLIDCVPKPQLGGDSTAEVPQHVETVCALRRGRQTNQLDRLDVVKQRLVRRRSGMVELVHDDDVKVARVEAPDVSAVQTLNRSEHVLEQMGPLASDPLLAEGRVAERVPEGGPALIDDLLTVGDEEEAAARQLLSKTRVVDGCHHRLSGAGRCHQQVAMVALVAGKRHVLEQRLLERAQFDLYRAEQRDVGSNVNTRAASELRGVVGGEVPALPVAREDRSQLCDGVRIARG